MTITARLSETSFVPVAAPSSPLAERYVQYFESQRRGSAWEAWNHTEINLSTDHPEKFVIPRLTQHSPETPSVVRQQSSARSLQPIQEWEGYVTEVGLETFKARLVDITSQSIFEEEVAELFKSDISDGQLQLVAEGSVFRWVIGYQRSSSGEKQRVSSIVFRRLPAWTKTDLQSAQTKATYLIEEIVWE